MTVRVFNRAFILCFTLAAGALTAAPSRETYRDAMGRNQGSATTDSSGNTTYRDSMGRLVGTAHTDTSGKVTYRDDWR